MSDSPAVKAIPIEGIGTFTFRKRNMRAEIAISVEFARLTEGAPVDEFTVLFCRAVAELKVLTVDAPEGWNVDEMDPYDDESYARVFKVRRALTESEGGTFRGARKERPAPGEGDSGDLRQLVPADLQPAADGPPIP